MNEKQRLLLEWMDSHGEPKISSEIKAAGFAIATASMLDDHTDYHTSGHLHQDKTTKPMTWQILPKGSRAVANYHQMAQQYGWKKSGSVHQRLVDALALIEQLEYENKNLRQQLKEISPTPSLEEHKVESDKRSELEFQRWQRIENGQQ